MIGDTPTSRHLARACISLEMGVMMLSDGLTPSLSLEAGFVPCASLDELLSRADVLSLHPDGDTAMPHLGASEFDRLGANGTLLTLNGATHFDVTAAHERVAAGAMRIGLAGHDPEETDVASLEALPGTLATQLRASDTLEARTSAAEEVLRIVHAYLLDSPLPHALNVLERPDAAAILTVRHRTAHGMLAHVLSVLDDEEIRVVAVHSTPFQGGEAAATFIHLEAVPGATIIEQIQQRDAIFDVDLVTHMSV